MSITSKTENIASIVIAITSIVIAICSFLLANEARIDAKTSKEMLSWEKTKLVPQVAIIRPEYNNDTSALLFGLRNIGKGVGRDFQIILEPLCEGTTFGEYISEYRLLGSKEKKLKLLEPDSTSSIEMNVKNLFKEGSLESSMTKEELCARLDFNLYILYGDQQTGQHLTRRKCSPSSPIIELSPDSLFEILREKFPPTSIYDEFIHDTTLRQELERAVLNSDSTIN
jgi:hypothetical protein